MHRRGHGLFVGAVCLTACFNPPVVSDLTGLDESSGTSSGDGDGKDAGDDSPTTSAGADDDGSEGGEATGDPPRSCDDLDCGAFGTCMVVDGEAACQCDLGYGGSSCDGCSPGFVLESDGCVADCGPCGEHALCDPTLAPPACSCVAGYEEAGANCDWGGGFADPSFASADSPWTTVSSVVDPAGFGDGDGAVTFNAIGWCGLSSVSQVVSMPAFANAEPLVLEVRGQRVDSASQECSFSRVDLALEVGSSAGPLGTPATTATETAVCLGEAAFGGDIPFAIRPYAQSNPACISNSGTACPPPTLREVSIRAAQAGECPLPGVVVNPGFDDASGWVLTDSVSNGYPFELSISGGRLNLGIEQVCSTVVAEQSLSFPRDPGVALRFDVEGTVGQRLELTLDGRDVASVPGSAGTTATVCVPAYARGSVHDLGFRLQRLGGCGGDAAMRFSIDDFELVSEPACERDDLWDGGFEADSTLSSSGWRFRSDAEGCGNCEGGFEIVSDPDEAHSGNGSMHVFFEALETFGGVDVQTEVRIPRAADGLRPAVRFFERTVGTGIDRLVVRPGNIEVATTPNWTEHEVCLNPDLGGQVVQLVFDLSHSNDVGSPVEHFIDDVRVELSDGC